MSRLPRSGVDRRQQPRRHEEALVHYAEQQLMAAALVVVDARRDGVTADGLRALGVLVESAEAFRWAVRQRDAADRQAIR